MAAWLEQYDPLDVIGNGSFGIIRKVRRKADGLIFARKELNFERMSERDRKQIVAEVNILKDLHHEHIVGYHDRFVDRDAGILYILMEYCGGGDLSSVIKQATKTNRPISEDTIWNYFMQILLALHHCHHPHGHGRSSSGSGSGVVEGDGGGGGGAGRRPQILHRDLKPDNVFLDEQNNVKLGDFGLSKALAQASFENTYVGTPYYMSPELMQEKAYDSKSDIWSLGCLIYELCALKPPFHEAKTHSELSILIRNGRIPPLPRGYSQSLFGVIKAMLNLNVRPFSFRLASCLGDRLFVPYPCPLVAITFWSSGVSVGPELGCAVLER
ncbi:kinase-like domain-containing protein [Ephemerocybe angulata]|uniref:non-specific serine/threonine protein kinase n=1 Tax=Ephemerocybe angulata TaxID=980116 RepID=A0A8H6HR39_9AGAR|nr:kinase-like domain-containing protein [Tulosesus angulatus]